MDNVLDQTKLPLTGTKLNMTSMMLHQKNSVHHFDYRHIFIFSKAHLRRYTYISSVLRLLRWFPRR